MNENLTQALIRLVVIFVTAGLGAFAANISLLKDAITDPVFAALVESVVIAVISAILKYLGGPTQKAVTSHGRGAGEGSTGRPNPLSV